jgi:hypothetical protein
VIVLTEMHFEGGNFLYAPHMILHMKCLHVAIITPDYFQLYGKTQDEYEYQNYSLLRCDTLYFDGYVPAF